jgi:ribosomal 50S subunit-associated protein YjgA (DUF615 family)
MPKWPSTPVDETPEDPRELRSRTDARKERLAAEEGLMKLSEELVRLGEGLLAKLELPDAVMDSIRNAQRVRAGAPQNRAIRLVRSALRDEDFEAIQKRLGKIHGPGGRRPPPRS